MHNILCGNLTSNKQIKRAIIKLDCSFLGSNDSSPLCYCFVSDYFPAKVADKMFITCENLGVYDII